jgi:hypothetical protein
MKSKNTFKPGDRVAMAAHWLKSTQAHDMGHRRGVVFAVAGPVVTVLWDMENRTIENMGASRVLFSNLVRVNRLHLEPH